MTSLANARPAVPTKLKYFIAIGDTKNTTFTDVLFYWENPVA